MEQYKLFVACGPFPPQLEARVREECRYRALYELVPNEPVRTDFCHVGLMGGLEELFPKHTWACGEKWPGRAVNGYYEELARNASGIYAFAAPALPDHGEALAALSDACDRLAKRLTLFLY